MGIFFIISLKWTALYYLDYVENSFPTGSDTTLMDAIDYGNEMLFNVTMIESSAVLLTFILSASYTWTRKQGLINSFVLLILTFIIFKFDLLLALHISLPVTDIAHWIFAEEKIIYILNGLLFLATGIVIFAFTFRQNRMSNKQNTTKKNNNGWLSGLSG